MASGLTQSISATAGALAANQIPPQATRGTESASAAGVQIAQSRALAETSAVSAREDKDRVVQREKRSEGSFADQPKPDDGESPPTAKETTSRLNKVA